MPIISMKGIQPMLSIFVKDLPMEHLVRGTQLLDKAVYFRYFKGYRIQKINRRKVHDMIEREIYVKENGALAELMMALWNRANDALYEEMLHHVKKINEDVEAIEKIEDEVADKIVDMLLDEYDRERILINIVLNQVRFSPEFVKSKLDFDLPERPVEETGAKAETTAAAAEPEAGTPETETLEEPAVQS